MSGGGGKESEVRGGLGRLDDSPPLEKVSSSGSDCPTRHWGHSNRVPVHREGSGFRDRGSGKEIESGGSTLTPSPPSGRGIKVLRPDFRVERPLSDLQ